MLLLPGVSFFGFSTFKVVSLLATFSSVILGFYFACGEGAQGKPFCQILRNHLKFTETSFACVGIGLILGIFITKATSKSSDVDTSYPRSVRNIEVDRRRLKSFPSPFPHGWYKLTNSSSLLPGCMIEVRALGQLFAVFRGEKDRKAYVLDAECPHLGANLTQGGRIVGDTVECPWHRWLWKGDGNCAHIPYQEEIPRAAKTRSWVVREIHGLVVIWFHSNPKFQSTPEYEPEQITEITSGKFRYGGEHSHDVRMHIQDFAENTADFQHFTPLHGNLRIPWTNVVVPGVTIIHKAEWLKAEEEERAEEGAEGQEEERKKEVKKKKQHQCHFIDDAYLMVRGNRIPKTRARGDVIFDGPGSITIFKFTIEGLGEENKPCIILFQTHLPVKPLLQRSEFRWFAHPDVSNFIVNYIVGNWVTQWYQDVSIWENKTFRRDPLLVKNDGPILGLRRWYQQFYLNSPAQKEEEEEEEEGGRRSGSCGSNSICKHPEWLDW